VQFTFSSAEEDNAEEEFDDAGRGDASAGRYSDGRGDAAMMMSSRGDSSDNSALQHLDRDTSGSYRLTGALLFNDSPGSSVSVDRDISRYPANDMNASFASSSSGYQDRVVGNLSLSLDE
jgi:hypothetical protein